MPEICINIVKIITFAYIVYFNVYSVLITQVIQSQLRLLNYLRNTVAENTG